MDELIAALKAAGEGSRDLDDEIHAVLGFDYETHCPLYTTSIDAALTLVPEGYAWKLHHFWNNPWSVKYFCEVRYSAGVKWETYAMTPALALCVAALKARQGLSHSFPE